MYLYLELTLLAISISTGYEPGYRYYLKSHDLSDDLFHDHQKSLKNPKPRHCSNNRLNSTKTQHHYEPSPRSHDDFLNTPPQGLLTSLNVAAIVARAKDENAVDAVDVVDAVDAVDAKKAVKAEIATEMGNRVSAPIAKIDSHTTDACRKRKCAQEGGNSRGNDERTCYQYRLPGHVKVDCVAYKRVREWWRVKKATATALTADATAAPNLERTIQSPLRITVSSTSYRATKSKLSILLLFDFPSFNQPIGFAPSVQSSLQRHHNRIYKSTCFLCSKCTFDCHNAQSASRPSTSNGSLECQSSALRSAIRDATWIWQTYVRCRRQRNIVSSSSPQPTSIRMLCQ